MGEALQRLTNVGFEHGPSFVNHAPMAAEAIAQLGHADEVAGWVDRNLRVRRYHDLPATCWRLSPDDESDWMSALGDFSRVADWTEMFERELAGTPWTDVLARWWQRLLPGMSGALTHGVIRTAHAVRGIAQTAADNQLARTELARGLGYWAARYSGRQADARNRAPEPGDLPDRTPAAWAQSLDLLVLENAEIYARQRPRFPIPLIHVVTAPAAVRLACEHLPAAQRWPSYLAARRCSDALRLQFGASGNANCGGPVEPGAEDDLPMEAEVVAAALELGDEHAIKLAEVAMRQNALLPDHRYLVAARAAIRRISLRPV
ncbi:hypothetical protein [Geodermatophilus sp. SYSU D01176]